MNIYDLKDAPRFQVRPWMVSGLDLKGTDLLLFSALYSMQQDGDGSEEPDAAWLCEACGCDDAEVFKRLTGFVNKGFVTFDLASGDVLRAFRIDLEAIARKLDPGERAVQAEDM